jgi:FtsH-binding integral membrane protein
MYLESDTGETAAKKAVLGALALYLDFINLFMMLLQLFRSAPTELTQQPARDRQRWRAF